MSFAPQYVQDCIRNRRRWAGKPALLGDWYVDLQRQAVDVVNEASRTSVKFDAEWFVYVPDVDDLLELVESQITAWGFKPGDKQLTLSYTPDKQWAVSVGYGNRLTEARGASIHEALMAALQQMIVFRTTASVATTGNPKTAEAR
jgi:hypothetical protein